MQQKPPIHSPTASASGCPNCLRASSAQRAAAFPNPGEFCQLWACRTTWPQPARHCASRHKLRFVSSCPRAARLPPALPKSDATKASATP